MKKISIFTCFFILGFSAFGMDKMTIDEAVSVGGLKKEASEQ